MCKTIQMIDNIKNAIKDIQRIKDIYELNIEEINQANVETNDILHFIELNNYNKEEKLTLYEEIQRVRQERREAKNRNERMKPLYNLLEKEGVFDSKLSNSLLQKLSKTSKVVQQKKDNQSERQFTPRIRTDLEKGVKNESLVEKLKHVMERNNN